MWCWIRVSDAPIEPKRIDHRPVVSLDRSVYVYGYSTLNGAVAQLWRTELDVLRWWQLRRGRPPRLDEGAAVALEEHSKLIFCSPSKPATPTATTRLQTWVYSVEQNVWTSISTPTELWDRRHFSFVTFNSTSVLLFGGISSNWSLGNGTTYSDMWMLSFQLCNISNSRWELIASSNNTNAPQPRFAQSSARWPKGMVIFGGHSRRRCFRDLWHFDVEKRAWKRWHSVNDKVGPDPRLDRGCFSTATAIGSHVLITTGCESKLWKSNYQQCSETGQHQTWLYLSHMKRWRFINWNSGLWGIETTTTFVYGGYALIANTATSFQLKYMLLRCPDGLVSPDINSTPCIPCSAGKYPSHEGQNCTSCPTGVTTSRSEAKSESDCDVCEANQCDHGDCYIEHHEGKPSTVCHCHIGFSGSKCHFPTYYLVALAVVTALLVAGLSVWAFVRIVVRKQQRERELKRQVEELISVWQIKRNELTLQEQIGVGGYGQVYRAQYREMTVAAKVLRTPDDEQSLTEFEREIRFMQTVRHPNIVMFIGAGIMDDNTQPFLVAEYMPRGSLRDVLEDRTITLRVTTCLRFALDAARGMAFLHSLLPPRIHNDLKSDNLLVSNNWVVKVSDFGSGLQLQLAKVSRTRRDSITTPLLADGYEMTGQPMGTVRWRAPEVSSPNDSNHSTFADVYR